jgi:hypothetical protein
MQSKNVTQPLLWPLALWLFSQQLGQCFYEPGLQRWINRDPIGGLGSRNLYGFTGNCPVGRIDRDGYTWVAPGPPFPGDHASVVCKGSKPVPKIAIESPKDVMDRLTTMEDTDKRNNATPRNPDAELKGIHCVAGCAYQHEQSHIKDILSQNPNICVGVSDGTTIGNNNPTELLTSEQKAHQVEADCLAKCKQTCPSDTVNGRVEQNNKWIQDHTFE